MLRIASVVALAAFAFSGAAQAQIAGPYIGVLATVDNINGSGDAEGFGATGAGASVVAGYNMVSHNLFGDRKCVVKGKRVQLRVDLCGRRIIKKTNTQIQQLK